MYYKIGIIHAVHVHSSLQEELLKQKNSNLYNNRSGETKFRTNLHLETNDYQINYVNIGLRHHNRISVVEAQTSLLRNVPSGEEKERRLYLQVTTNLSFVHSLNHRYHHR